jgi:hypothetical protein
MGKPIVYIASLYTKGEVSMNTVILAEILAENKVSD